MLLQNTPNILCAHLHADTLSLLCLPTDGSIQWTGTYGDSSAPTVPTSAPDVTLYNADRAAQAVYDHLTNVTILPDAYLTTGGPPGCCWICRVDRSKATNSYNSSLWLGC